MWGKGQMNKHTRTLKEHGSPSFKAARKLGPHLLPPPCHRYAIWEPERRPACQDHTAHPLACLTAFCTHSVNMLSPERAEVQKWEAGDTYKKHGGGDLIWGENTSRELIGSEGGEIGWDLLLKGVEYKTPGFGPFFHVEDRELLRASEQRSGGTLASFCPLEHVRTSDWERGKTFRVPGKERARRDSSYLLSENNKYSFIIAFPFLQKNYITSFISFLI